MLNIILVKLKGYKDSWPMILIMTVMALVLTYVFGKGFEGQYVPSVGIVDLEQSVASESFVKQLEEEKIYTFEQTTLEEGLENVENGNYIALIEIGPSTFSLEEKDIQNKGLTIYKNGESIEHQNLWMFVQRKGSMMAMNQAYVEGLDSRLSSSGLEIDQEQMLSRINDYRESYPLIEIESIQRSGETSSGYDALRHSFIGFLLFFSMFTMIFSVGSIVEEKEDFVWQRQSVTPIPKWKIMLANIISAYIGGMIQLALMILVSRYLFNIDFGGSILLMLIVLSFYVLAITALGVLLSTLVKTPQQLGSFSPVIIVGSSMLGGCMWPLSIINSKLLLFLADLMPQRWAYSGLEMIIINHAGFGQIIHTLLNLALITVVLFLAASLVTYKIGEAKS